MWANEDRKGEYPPHPFGGPTGFYFGTLGNDSTGPMWLWGPGYDDPRTNVPREPYVSNFIELVAGQNPAILYCPVVQSPLKWWSPTSPGDDPDPYGHDDLFYRDPDWYGIGYHRFAAFAADSAGSNVYMNWSNSGNIDTTGPPMRPGSSQDAIAADIVEGVYFDLALEFHDNHSETAHNYTGYRETNVAYSDGHAETHKHHPVHGGGWDGESIHNHANQLKLW